MANSSKCKVDKHKNQIATSATPVLCEVMESIQYNSNVRRFVEQYLEMFNSLLLCKVQSELLLQLLMYVSVFDIWNIRVDHQGH